MNLQILRDVGVDFDGAEPIDQANPGADAIIITTVDRYGAAIEALRSIGAGRVFPVNSHSVDLAGDIASARASAVATRASDLRPSLTLLRAANSCRAPLPESFGALDPHIRSMARLKGAPDAFVAATLLATVSGLATGRFFVRARAGFDVAPIIWTALVGDASSNKSPAMDAVLDSLRRIEGRHYAAWKSDDEQTGVAPRGHVNDSTIEALQALLAAQGRGALAAYDELASWFAGLTRYSKSAIGDRGHWLAAHNGAPITVDRRYLKAPMRVPCWGVALCGGIQPSVLAELAQNASLENGDGLDTRLMYVRPVLAPVEIRPEPGDDSAIPAFDRIIERLFAWRIQAMPSTPLELTPEALESFERWRVQMLQAARKSASEVDGWTGKLPGALLRVAGCLALIDAAAHGPNPPETISLDVLRRSRVLLDMFSAHRRKVLAERGTDSVERYAAETGAFILDNRAPNLDTYALRSGVIPGLRGDKMLRSVLLELQAARWISTAINPRQDEPLPATVAVNPAVFDLTP